MKQAVSVCQKVLIVLKSRSTYSFYILFLVFGFCTLFYYFGELVDFMGWAALRWGFFYGVHDIHRLLFLVPIIYAGYVFGVKATVIMTILSVAAFLPRAVFISPFPDPLLRIILFSIIAGIMGYLTAVNRLELERRRLIEAQLLSERQKLQGILERMADGVLIIGPDYRVRFTNQSIVRNFGEGIGAYCYQYLHQFDKPCGESCKLADVLSGSSERWEYIFPHGITYEIVASPYVDSDGKTCQLAIFRNITQRKS